jgi:hypothetical protein
MPPHSWAAVIYLAARYNHTAVTNIYYSTLSVLTLHIEILLQRGPEFCPDIGVGNVY